MIQPSAFHEWPKVSLGELAFFGISFKIRRARFERHRITLYLLEKGVDQGGLPYARPLVLYRGRHL